jgi:O-antigen ligase
LAPFSLILATAVVARRYPLTIPSLIFWGLVIGAFGGALSLAQPSLFRSMSVVADATAITYDGRAFGFYLQPNGLAMGMVILFLLFIFSVDPEQIWRIGIASALLVSTVIFSGSRAGMIETAILLTLMIVIPVFSSYSRGRSLPIVRTFPIVALFLALTVILVLLFSEDLGFFKQNGLADRIASLFDRGKLKSDGSVQGRLYLQKLFVQRALNRPWFGHGLGSVTYYIDSGRYLAGAAHNSLLDWWFQFGAVGVTLMGAAVYRVWADLGTDKSAHTRRWRTCFFLVVLCFIFASNMLAVMRPFWILIGAIYGLMSYKELNTIYVVRTPACQSRDTLLASARGEWIAQRSERVSARERAVSLRHSRRATPQRRERDQVSAQNKVAVEKESANQIAERQRISLEQLKERRERARKLLEDHQRQTQMAEIERESFRKFAFRFVLFFNVPVLLIAHVVLILNGAGYQYLHFSLLFFDILTIMTLSFYRFRDSKR